MSCLDLRYSAQWLTGAASLLLLLASGGAAHAVGGGDGPNQPLGFVGGVPYAGGEYGGIDSVSTYSGALAMGLPIGQGFRVGGGGLGYGFTLFYNSNVWTYQEGKDGTQSSFVVATPNSAGFNAGLGWNLSLGRLLRPSVAPNTTDDWVYIGADGSSHKFFNLLHVGDGTPNSAIKYTRDGSYLRLNISSPSNAVVEFPDGTAHVFNAGSGGSGRPKLFRDRFRDAQGNYLNTVTITYPNATTWKIQDSDGRLHYVYFDADPDNGGKVTQVELQAFGSTPGNRQTATWTFSYESAAIRRTCQDTWWGNNVTPGDGGTQEAMVNVALLEIVTGPIELPAGERVRWAMQDDQGHAAYHPGAVRSNDECHSSGVIERIELPSHGKVAWDWKLWNFPPTGKAYVDKSPGVWRRTIVNDQSMDWNTATWVYDSMVASGEVQTDVRDPEGDYTRFYFYAPATTSMPWDYSLPITKRTAPDSGGRYLSQERIAANGTVLRQTWLKFEKDDTTGIVGDNKILSNRRVVSSRIVHLDDGGRWAQTDLSEFDGLGHYRLATMSGNFPTGSNSRTERIEWNDGRGCYSQCSGAANYVPVPTSTPWILGMFSLTQQAEGWDTATQKYTFNSQTGFLEQTRSLVAKTADGDMDVIALSCPDSRGYVVSQRFYGGTNTLPGKIIGCGASSDSTYRIDIEYMNGVASRSTWKTVAGVSVGFDNGYIPSGGVDATTGLVKASCDSAGYCTEYEYDLLGRVLQVRAATSAGAARAATVNYAYSYVAGPWQGWQVATTLACPVGLTCSPTETAGYPASTVHYDGFGRAFKTDRQNADGTWSKQYAKYDRRGAVVFSSEWTAGLTGTGAEPGTTFSNFDALGRARSMTAPDGHVSTWNYVGGRIVTRTEQIASGAFPGSGPVAEQPHARSEEYDRFGRLVRVSEPSGPGNQMVDTTMAYDVGGRLREVAHLGQVRSYVYDRRGFLKSTTIPEYGPSGNGTKYNCSFDALGNAWKVREVPCNQTATRGVVMSLDAAQRVTSVSEEGGRLLKEFLYEAGTGRLSVAKAFNYLPEIGFTTFEVDQTYSYAGIAGAVSSRQTEFFVNGLPQESFTTGVTLDRAGQLVGLDYPTCTGGACGSPGVAGRSVGYVYAKGFLSKVPGFVDTAVTYHANGMFAQIRHSNGMRIDQSIDPATMMARPLSVNVFQGDGSAISYAGPYDFDGAGNIKAIGTGKLYRYDGVSRLIESRETWGSTTYVQKPTFDAWGNIQELETGPMGSTQVLSTPTSSATNRLTTAGTQYDAEGNLVLWNSGPSYEYDAFNRMRRFRGGVAPGSEEWVFAYTADDERVFSARVGGGGTVWSLRGLDNQLLREWRAENGKHSFRDYVWTGRNLLAKIERTPAAGSPGWSEETRHAAVDHLGSVRLWTDAAGANLPGFIYYPFGKQLNGTVDDEQMRFTGHERDLWNTTSSNDDLDYMHARHYNPQLGRFLQIDPLVGKYRLPQSLNRYAYTRNNPLSRIDRFGRSDEPAAGFGGTINVTDEAPKVKLTGGIDPLDMIDILFLSWNPVAYVSGEPQGRGNPNRQLRQEEIPLLETHRTFEDPTNPSGPREIPPESKPPTAPPTLQSPSSGERFLSFFSSCPVSVGLLLAADYWTVSSGVGTLVACFGTPATGGAGTPVCLLKTGEHALSWMAFLAATESVHENCKD